MDDFSEYLKLRNNCDPEEILLSASKLGQRLSKIHLNHVNQADLAEVSQALNLEQLIPTDKGYFRDYRGLAELMDFSPVEIETQFKRSHNPTKSLIDAFKAKNLYGSNESSATLNDLIKMIESIERFDVLDDFLPKLIHLATTSIHLNQQVALNKPAYNETYDAFICYAQEDTHYAQQIISFLERHHKRVATAEDLTPGLFEHDALIRLIDEKCRKVIVILTSNFTRSKECEFQTKFASEIGIKAGSFNIIPIIYESLDISALPKLIQMLSKIDMTNYSNQSRKLEMLVRSLDQNACELRINSTMSNDQTTNLRSTSYEVRSSIEGHQNNLPAITLAQDSHSTNCDEPIVELHTQDSNITTSSSNLSDTNLIHHNLRNIPSQQSIGSGFTNRPNWFRTVWNKSLTRIFPSHSSSNSSQIMLIQPNPADSSQNQDSQ